MSDFDYGNTRLRVMKSRLFTRPQLEALAEAGSVNALVAALSQTVYSRPIEAALTRSTGLDSVHEALHADLTGTLVRARGFYTDQAADLVAILYRFYDIRNLKTILRGVEGRTPPQGIRPALLPVGEIPEDVLAELVQAPDARAAIDLLASMRIAIVVPLMALRAENPGAGVPAMELALDRWFYTESFELLEENGDGARRMIAALQLEADIANLLTALRFAFDPEAHKQLREAYDVERLRDLFVGPGQVSPEILERAGDRENVEAAVGVLLETPYAEVLQAGLAEYGESALLSAFEGHLNRFRLRWMNRLMVRDPLGIGIPIGYLALKAQEVNNLRWIAQGLHMGLDAAAIRAGLEVAG